MNAFSYAFHVPVAIGDTCKGGLGQAKPEAPAEVRPAECPIKLFGVIIMPAAPRRLFQV